MKGLVILILGFLTFQPVAFSELLTQIDPNIAAESDTGQPGNVWMGTLRCYTEGQDSTNFFPLDIFCHDEIGVGTQRDIIDRRLLEQVRNCCQRNEGHRIEIDCTIIKKRGPDYESVATFPCS